jgi:hypothetical protein
MKKSPLAFTTGVQYLNWLQTLAIVGVALGRMAITSIILAISEAGVIGGSVYIHSEKSCNFSSPEATVCGLAALTCSMGRGMQPEHGHVT